MAQKGSDIFIHLRLHTAYSLLEGALRIERLGALCRAANMPAVAMTDSGNLFGALEFAQALRSEGIQPIIGCTLPVLLSEQEQKRDLPVLAFLAKDETGYQHLMKLTSLAHNRIGAAGLHITREDIVNYQQGLICLTGGPAGVINRHLQRGDQQAAALMDELAGIFSDRLYVELQRHGAEGALEEEKTAESWLVDMARKKGLGLVATNEAYFPAAEDFEAHDALMCISQGAKVADQNRRRLTAEHYFKTGAEMAALFEDLPEAIANSAEIAQRCAFCPTPRDVILPRFTKISSNKSEADYLREITCKGLDDRLAQMQKKSASESDYRKRLDSELNMIIEMGFAGYFLIVADFVQWAHQQNIPVGPGRGSGAGSLVAYALRITDLDPLRFGLIFERFLNPERISMPDFDIDFCQERRDEVIAYVRDHYGADHVAHIITFGTLQARAVLRDVGRVLGLPYGQVDRLCKFVPNNPSHPVKLADAIDSEPALQEARNEDQQIAKLLDISLKLEGLFRHASTHAAGLVIGDRKLDELIPMSNDPRSLARLTQFSMKWVEQAGLVKFDFLGLKTLTVLRLTRDFLAKRGVDMDINAIPLDDPETYALLSRAETVGLFQLESGGMRDALRKTEPDRIEDLIALVALYRPGPMENIPRYISGKKGAEEIDYLHPSLEPVLRETFGVIIYQEQVMQIARVLSGYSAAEADLLRRAMGKKIKAEMDLHKKSFVEGATKNNVAESVARHIFDLVARFAGYGFNKSHAAAYAMLAYQTAWLKTHYPVEYLAALMTSDIHSPEKINQLKQEASRIAIEVSAPDINRSEARFVVFDGKIIHALAAIRNVGGEAAKAITACREPGGFTDIFDFARRCPPSALNKRAFESLAAAGAFDQIHPNRRQLFEQASRVIALGRSPVNEMQEALFEVSEQPGAALPACEDWPPPQRLAQEFEATGMYLSGHPLSAWREQLEEARIVPYVDFCAGNASAGRLAGVITAVHERRSRRGNPFVFLALSDLSGEFEVVVFADLLRASRSFLEVGALVLVDVEIDREGEALRLRAQNLKQLSANGAGLRSQQRRQMQVKLFLERVEALDDIKRHLSAHPGGTRVHLVVPESSGEVEIGLPGAFALNEEMAQILTAIPGVSRIEAA